MNQINGDVLLVNGVVHTLDPAGTITEAVLIENGRVVATGSSADVSAMAGDSVERIDLRGRTVIPGLIDAHAHVELGTYANRWWRDVRFLGREEALERLRGWIAELNAGDWIVAQATYAQDLPSREDLDEIAHTNPVLIRWSMHLLVANSAALRAAGIDRAYAAPAGSRVQVDEHGEPTGIVEEGFDLFPVPYPGRDWLVAELELSMRKSFLVHGVTTVHELPATTAGVEAWQSLHSNGALPTRMVINPIVAPGHQPTVADLDTFLGVGLRSGFGDEWLRLGALKVFIDGDEDAALWRAQLERTPRSWGLPPRGYNDVVALVTKCLQARMQLWLHAIGDSAQEFVLDAIEDGLRRVPSEDHRTRVEHLANHVRSDSDLLERIGRIGVIPVPTAAFMYSTVDRDPNSGIIDFPYRTLERAGLKPPGNSDSAGTQPFATNPWFGMACMMHRRNKRGELLSREEAVDFNVALRTYTTNAAWATFEEHRKGALIPGLLGDAVVLDADPFAMTGDEIADVEPDMVIVNGTVACAKHP